MSESAKNLFNFPRIPADISDVAVRDYLVELERVLSHAIRIGYYLDAIRDVDLTTISPSANQCLKFNGSMWVPGDVSDTDEFTFSIAAFSDGISDNYQLIGDGEWKGIGDITFTAGYNFAPDGMTAEVAMSGSATPWSGNLSMTPVEGPETNTESVEYPSSATGTITFTLSQSADETTDVESVLLQSDFVKGSDA